MIILRIIYSNKLFFFQSTKLSSSEEFDLCDVEVQHKNKVVDLFLLFPSHSTFFLFQQTIESDILEYRVYNEGSEPYDFYRLFLTDEILDLIVEQINIYNNQKMIQNESTKISKTTMSTVKSRKNELFLELLYCPEICLNSSYRGFISTIMK